MTEITLFELGPTRSARCRWTLLEAGLKYKSIGNEPSIIHSDELSQVHPLGKLPAAIIDGKPLFESAAIAAAIADLVPEQNLIAKPGTWSRTLHDQWVLFALTEMECWCTSAEFNTLDFVLPKEQHVPAILPQIEIMFKRSAAALNATLAKTPYLVEGRFTVADIIVGYTVNFGDWLGWIGDFPNVIAYQERLFEREHCTLARHQCHG